MMPTRTRRQRAAAPPAPQSPPVRSFRFQGQTFETYQDMVDAKRRRNREMLAASGLLEASSALRDEVDAAAAVSEAPSKRGIAARRKRRSSRDDDAAQQPRRKSNRLAGVASAGLYVEDERSGRFTIGGAASTGEGLQSSRNVAYVEEEDANERFFNDRINDGSKLAVSDAVELSGTKWVRDGTVASAERFMRTTLPSIVDKEVAPSPKAAAAVTPSPPRSSAPSSSSSSSSLISQIAALTLDDPASVAKVTPDRIYSVACHPSPHVLLPCAGDKQGHVGLWNVDGHGGDTSGVADADGVHLFKPHNRPVTHLEWNAAGTRLLSASYDGTVRLFDVATQTFDQIFATYDKSPEFRGSVGFGLDQGSRYWVQYVCIDHRSADDGGKCLFLSTSVGTVVHVDLRQRGRVTFDEELSEKKINTVSLHPNGTTLATAGLDTTVQLWDVRRFASRSRKSKAKPDCTPLATQRVGKSINSAFFSPSGGTLLTTTMADTLDIISNAHLQSGLIKSPTKRIRHNNKTGRWLSTFMARWHPSLGLSGDMNDEVFVVGSMQQPRTIELFGGSKGNLLRGVQGDALTAVASRCCFHPGAERLIVVGGNSSGRVTVAR